MDCADIDITEIDVTYRLTGIALDFIYGICPLDGAVFHEDVVYIGDACLVSRHKIFPLIEHVGVNLEETASACTMAVAHIDMVDEASTTMVGLKIHHPEDAVRSLAVFHQYVPHASAHLASDAQQAMAFYYFTITYHYILRWLAYTPCVPVTSRLDDNGIVALVELAILNEHISCHFKVYAIVVMVVRIDIEVACDATITQEEMDSPEWSPIDAEAIEQHVRASVEMYKMRSHVVVAYGHLALLHGYVCRGPGIKLLGCLQMFLWPLEPWCPTFMRGCSFPFPVMAMLLQPKAYTKGE